MGDDLIANAPSCLPPGLLLDLWMAQPDDCQPVLEQAGICDIKKWRLQALLASKPHGLPATELLRLYENVYKQDLETFGFKDVPDMLGSMPGVFTVRRPNHLTAILFPDHPNEEILYDSRVPRPPDTDDSNIVRRVLPGDIHPEDLISAAWLNSDTGIPNDAALPGDAYLEAELPLSLVKLDPSSEGIFRGVISAVDNPNSVYIQLEGDYLDDVHRLSGDVCRHFSDPRHKRLDYVLPEEFIIPGYPCLYWNTLSTTWERAEIVRPIRDNRVIVNLVDYGGCRSAKPGGLLMLPRRFLHIPKQAIQVSLLGLQPYNSEASTWTKESRQRVLDFSHARYWLECHLVKPLKSGPFARLETETNEADAHLYDPHNQGSQALSEDLPLQAESYHYEQQPTFEALICDRNHPEMDIFVNDVLTMEMHARLDPYYVKLESKLKSEFAEATRILPRSNCCAF